MPTEILMPALSPTMEEGTLAKWHVREGDEVRTGDVIAEIETDKATMEIEAIDDGRMGKILVAEGTEHVPVNEPIALLLVDGEDERSSFETRPAAAPQDEGSTPHPIEQMAKIAEAIRAVPSQSADRAVDDEDLGERPPEIEEAPAGPQTAPAEPRAEPEIPPGTEMVTMTVREALRDAMAEEMRADDRVFLMGEEVGQYQGAYKVSQGLLDEFGEQARDRHAHHRICLRRRRRRRGLCGAQAHRRVHDLELRHAGDRPHRQLRRQDALYVRRADALPHRVSRPERRGSARRRPAQPGFLGLVCVTCRG